jgi:hypothetical protein
VERSPARFWSLDVRHPPGVGPALEGLQVPYLEEVLLWMSEATRAGGEETSIPPHLVLALMLAFARPVGLNLITPCAGLAAVSRR